MLGSSDSRLLDLEQGEKSKGEGNVYEGLERAVKRIINALYSSSGGIPGGLFIGVVRGGPVIMSERPPNCPVYMGYIVMLASQSFHTCNCFIQDLLHDDTCPVPQASVLCSARTFSPIPAFLPEIKKIRKLLRESMHAEVIARDDAQGVFDTGPLACAPLISTELDVRDDAEESLRCEASDLHPQQ
jgi:hypothetical protein